MDGAGGIDGRSGDGLGGGQAHVAAGQGDRDLHGFVPGGAGVAIGGERQNGIRFEQFAGRRVLLFGEPERSARQCHRDRVGFTEHGNILI